MDKLLDIKPVWLLFAVSGMFVVSLVIAVAAMASLGVLAPPSSSSPTAFPGGGPSESETPGGASAPIGGSVWHDLCAGGVEGQPDPASPPPGCIWVGDQNSFSGDAVRQSGEPGIGEVLVELGPGACPSIGLATTFTAEDGSFTFSDIAPGTYCVSVDPGLGSNASILAPGQWTAPERVSGRIQVGVAVGLGEGAHGVDLGWDYQFLPAPEPTPVASSTATPGLTECTDKASFVADVAIPDDTNIKPGGSFKKTWRILNAGTCSWDSGYSVVFASGERMGATSPTALPGVVQPGSTVDISLDLVGPASSGTYKGNWLLRNPAGALFGVGSQGDQPFWVQIVVGATATPVPAPWKAEFYDNRDLDGDPDLVRRDATIDFDWKRDAPANGISEDNFSVRWTGKFSFDVGAFQFSVLVDDGARLWVDDQLVIDEWVDGGERQLTTVVGLTKGTHDVRLEYYEHTREARVRLKWEKVDSPGFADWKAEFWSNRDLSGDPILTRNDTNVEFDWKAEAPAVGVPADNFSVRWSRKLTFDEGTYRFTVKADDGVRVFVDGQRVINEWHDSGGDTYHVDLNLSGKRRVVIEYYEHSGRALVQFSWDRLSPTPTQTSTLTATPTATQAPPSSTPTPTPTATSEPTSTSTPTPTSSPTATSDPGSQIVFDLVARACAASWTNGGQALPCPGMQGDEQGSVLSLSSPLLETGSPAEDPALSMSPQSVENGWIEGTFPLFDVQTGDRFKATLGCVQGQISCSVLVQLSYLLVDDELKPKLLGSWSETYDGQLTAVDIDLDSLAGKSVSFVVTVRGAQASSQNQALWVGPAVWR
jgi:hypothetical protein